MLFVKAICGFVVHTHFNLSEGEIAPVEDDKVDFTVKRLEDRGIIKIFKNYEDAFKHEFKKVAELAAESLASMNPGVDYKGNPLPAPAPTYDFEKSLPIIVKEDLPTVVKEDSKPIIKKEDTSKEDTSKDLTKKDSETSKVKP